jgi:hypothetical protein
MPSRASPIISDEPFETSGASLGQVWRRVTDINGCELFL